jgi:hypothetical protein
MVSVLPNVLVLSLHETIAAVVSAIAARISFLIIEVSLS